MKIGGRGLCTGRGVTRTEPPLCSNGSPLQARVSHGMISSITRARSDSRLPKARNSDST